MKIEKTTVPTKVAERSCWARYMLAMVVDPLIRESPIGQGRSKLWTANSWGCGAGGKIPPGKGKTAHRIPLRHTVHIGVFQSGFHRLGKGELDRHYPAGNPQEVLTRAVTEKPSSSRRSASSNTPT